MDSDFKFFIWILVLAVVAPLTAMFINDYQRNNCRLELARTGWYTPAEINEVCK